jgi:hypothetical protein
MHPLHELGFVVLERLDLGLDELHAWARRMGDVEAPLSVHTQRTLMIHTSPSACGSVGARVAAEALAAAAADEALAAADCLAFT